MHQVTFNIAITGETPVLPDIDPIATAYDIEIIVEDQPDDDDYKIVTAKGLDVEDVQNFIAKLFGEDSDEVLELEIKHVVDETQ